MMIGPDLLNIAIYLPLAAGVLIALLPRAKEHLSGPLALTAALLAFIPALALYLGFDPALPGMQFAQDLPWLSALGARYAIGLDGISLLLFILTAFLAPIAVLSSFTAVKEHRRFYYASLLALQTGMLGVFAALDLLLFYVFWEAMLIPMYFIIGIWGGKRRVYASVKFFIYTMAGSLLMLAAILWLYFDHQAKTGVFTFALTAYGNSAAGGTGMLLFLAFALAFAIKVPLWPFHTWLPDAHVEAPTAGSIILAGVLLKMGVYGFIRIAVPFFPEAAMTAGWPIAALGAFGVIYGSLTAWAQDDIKKLVAYSSVAHLGIVMVGALVLEPAAVGGAVLQMVNHGLSTGALFLCVGMLYERRHTRLMADYGGIAKVMPAFAAVFMIVTLSSIGLPGLNGFIGEFLILFGTFKVWPCLALISLGGVILSAVYMLGMYQKVFFGPVTDPANRDLPDLKAREWLCVLPLLVLIVWIGVYPNFFLRRIDTAVNDYIRLAGGPRPVFSLTQEGK